MREIWHLGQETIMAGWRGQVEKFVSEQPYTLVMPGLDPGIHRERVVAKRMDCRVKPGNDGKHCFA
jgi:hypothetical protein